MDQTDFPTLECESHGESTHVKCDFCERLICTDCVMANKLSYRMFYGTTENPHDSYVVACWQGTHGKYLCIPPKDMESLKEIFRERKEERCGLEINN